MHSPKRPPAHTSRAWTRTLPWACALAACSSEHAATTTSPDATSSAPASAARTESMSAPDAAQGSASSPGAASGTSSSALDASVSSSAAPSSSEAATSEDASSSDAQALTDAGDSGTEPHSEACEVVGSSSVPSGHANDALWHLPGGFALLPNGYTPPPVPWLVENLGHEWSVLTVADGLSYNGNLIPSAVAGNVDDPRLLLFDYTSGAEPTTDIWQGQAYGADGMPITPLTDVLHIFYRGTALNVNVTSLDGERVLLGNGHTAVWDPRIVLLTKDAQVVSEEVKLFDTEDNPTISCFKAVGTEHGALAAVLDEATKTLHATELAADGSIVAQASWPLPESFTSGTYSPCPWLSADSTGSYFAFKGSDSSSLPSIAVYRLGQGTLEPLLAIPTVLGASAISWVQGGPSPLLALWEGALISFAHWTGDALARLDGRFPAKDLRVYGDEIFVLDDSSSEGLVISQVRCGTSAAE